LTRTAAYLVEQRTDATAAERDAYDTRKKTLMAKFEQIET
jgi:hypothetical protein